MADGTKTPISFVGFLEKMQKEKKGLTFAAKSGMLRPASAKYSEEESNMKRRGTAMMMCEMCMGMMSMCMFLRAQNDRLLSKNCLSA